MSRPDDLDRAEARAAAARERLSQSSSALQEHLTPAAITSSLKRHAQERQRTLVTGAIGIAAVAGTVALVGGLLKRRRRKQAQLADPAAHARRVHPSTKQPSTTPRVRRSFKRIQS